MGQCNSIPSAATANSIKGISTPPGHPDIKLDNTGMGDVIVSPEELKKLLSQGAGNLRLLDVTIGGADGYKSSHIHGAVYMDIFHKAEPTKLIPRNIPTPEVFEAYVRSLGINTDSDIILYDHAESGGGYMSSGRAWFLFRYHGHKKVRILDGGLAKWKAGKYATTSEMPNMPEGNFTVSVRPELLKTFEDMKENLESNDYQVSDTRPMPGYQQGHIKGAKSIPFVSKLIDSDNKCLYSVSDLKAAFEEAGLDVSKPVVGSCMGGMTSCTLLVAMAVMGYKDMPLYMGSWTEWSQRASDDMIETS